MLRIAIPVVAVMLALVTGLGTKGVLEVLNTNKWLDSPAYKSTKAKFIPNAISKSIYKGKLYGLPCIIGGTVIYYNRNLLDKAGVRNLPRTPRRWCHVWPRMPRAVRRWSR